MRTPVPRRVAQFGVTGLLVITIAAPVSAQEREWHEFGERVGRAAAALANSVVAEVAAAMEETGQQRGQQPRGRRPERDDRDVLTEEFSQSYNVGRNGRLRVETLYGNITIERGGGEAIQVRALKRVRNTSEAQARRIMPNIAVVVTTRGSSVDVETANRSGGNWQGQVDYTISVPPSTQLFLESRSGNIHITGIEGDIRAETFSGNVTATDVKRARDLSSFSGNVTITDSDGEDFSGESHSGNIVVRNVKASVIALETTTGNLRVNDIESTRATLETLSGTIEYQGRLARGGRYEMRSHSGNIRVLPTDAGPFQLEAATQSGSVRSDFPVMLNSFRQQRRNFTAPPLQPEATTTSDSAVLALRTFSGNIVITKR